MIRKGFSSNQNVNFFNLRIFLKIQKDVNLNLHLNSLFINFF